MCSLLCDQSSLRVQCHKTCSNKSWSEGHPSPDLSQLIKVTPWSGVLRPAVTRSPGLPGRKLTFFFLIRKRLQDCSPIFFIESFLSEFVLPGCCDLTLEWDSLLSLKSCRFVWGSVALKKEKNLFYFLLLKCWFINLCTKFPLLAWHQRLWLWPGPGNDNDEVRMRHCHGAWRGQTRATLIDDPEPGSHWLTHRRAALWLAGRWS